MPLAIAHASVEMCARLELPNLKVKVGSDTSYNETILALCRKILGEKFDLRVDANSAWSAADANAQMEICARYGVRVIEQPFPSSTHVEEAVRMARKSFAIMADEGVLTSTDIGTLASSGSAQILNFRLSKNGGISRVLALAAQAESQGLSYQLGCMVGETTILSCLGRITASILPAPLYVEGSYDDILLDESIAVPSFSFGLGGKAPIVRNAGMGYQIDKIQLEKFTRARVAV
jgi:muconate cycloisomerase